MSLTNQYLILDKNLKRVGTLTIDGATQFSNDSIKIQLADSDNTSTSYDDDVNVGTQDNFSGTINLNAQSKKFDHSGSADVLQGQPDSDKAIAGNNLAYYDAVAGHWYVMRIYSTDEANTGAVRHITTLNLTNLMLYTLAHHYPIAMPTTSTSIQDAFKEVFSSTGWTLKFNTNNTMVSSFSIDGKSKASTLLQTLLQTYNVEIDAYVEIDSQGNILSKTCEVVDQLNVNVVYNEAIFGRNMTSIKRTTVFNPITKIIPYGHNGSTIAKANGGKAYIVDEDANREYNPDWQLGMYYEGVITANSIEHPAGLKAWAQEIMKLYNHPRSYYEVAVTPDFNPPLGATIRFKDELIKPVLDAQGRAIQRTISFANPDGNTVGFGEYVTVIASTPAWLTGYQNALLSALEKARTDASSVRPVASTPDGVNFNDAGQTKRVILGAWESGTNISSYIDNKGFIWRRYNTDGTVDPGYKATGYLINAPRSAVGTLHGTIETGYIQDSPEVSLDTTEITHLGDFNPINTTVGTTNAAQYMCRLSNGQYITSRAVNKKTTKDTLYVLHNADFSTVSMMKITNGGHGASFSIEETSSGTYIWASTCVDMSSESYAISRFPYVADATITPSDSRVSKYYDTGKKCFVNADIKHGYVLCGYPDGHQDILKLAAIQSGNYDVLYSFNITNYGFEIGKGKQTYQSQVLDFPYVYWQSGNVDMHDSRMVYGINVVHKGQEFAMNYLLDMDLKMTDDAQEPETCNVLYDAQGNRKLLVTFNCTNAAGTETERVFTIPIKVRPAATEINTGVIETDEE
ncbi:phage tail protein [Lactiplantibacillus paraxiangfangensis]|uniref:phage baseplate protein n=1 Tax=Lactiplantibacillus paraxiangfangensis TaxID=3076224 RepID=UPI0030C6B531